MTAPDAHDKLRECEHHSWAGLMALLDEHWSADIFPTREDDLTRDAGARIVSLIRWVDRLRADAERQARARAAAELRAAAADIRRTTVLGHIAERLERRADALTPQEAAVTAPGPDHELEALIGPEDHEPGSVDWAPQEKVHGVRDDDYSPAAIDRDQATDQTTDQDGTP